MPAVNQQGINIMDERLSRQEDRESSTEVLESMRDVLEASPAIKAWKVFQKANSETVKKITRRSNVVGSVDFFQSFFHHPDVLLYQSIEDALKINPK
jgi:hypothetical protein